MKQRAHHGGLGRAKEIIQLKRALWRLNIFIRCRPGNGAFMHIDCGRNILQTQGLHLHNATFEKAVLAFRSQLPL